MPEYTKYRSDFNAGIQKIYGRLSHERFTKLALGILKDTTDLGFADSGDYATMLAGLAMMELTTYYPLTHYFVAPGVAGFCEECVKTVSKTYRKRFPQVTGFHVMAGSTERTGCLFGGLLFHFPVQERRRSLLLMYVTDPGTVDGVPAVQTIAGWISDGRSMAYIPEDTLSEAELATISTENLNSIKLVMGLSLYIDAFPDAVRPADHGPVPAHEGPRKTFLSIGAVPQVQHETANSRSPHYRRGHFRCLASDRFVHKRGLTIWIDGFFVGGTALDVCDDTPKQGD